MAATVLLVEDEPELRELLRSCLERAGFTVLSTGSGAEAITLAASAAPDLVVLDLGLPDVPGETVARELRAACPAALALQLGAAAVAVTGIILLGRSPLSGQPTVTPPASRAGMAAQPAGSGREASRRYSLVLQLSLAEVELPGGRRLDHRLLRLPPAVLTTALDDQDRVLLLWRYRSFRTPGAGNSHQL